MPLGFRISFGLAIRFGGAEQVIRYLGRVALRVGISNHRLVPMDERGITFRTKDGKTVTSRRTPSSAGFSSTCCPTAITWPRHDITWPRHDITWPHHDIRRASRRHIRVPWRGCLLPQSHSRMPSSGSLERRLGMNHEHAIEDHHEHGKSDRREPRRAEDRERFGASAQSARGGAGGGHRGRSERPSADLRNRPQPRVVVSAGRTACGQRLSWPSDGSRRRAASARKLTSDQCATIFANA